MTLGSCESYLSLIRHKQAKIMLLKLYSRQTLFCEKAQLLTNNPTHSGPGLRPNFVPAATLQGRDHHRPPPLELVDFPPVLSHPSPLQAPHGGPFRLPKHFNLDHFGLSAADVAESVREEW